MTLNDLLTIIDIGASVRIFFLDDKGCRRIMGYNSLMDMTETQKERIDELKDLEVYNLVANKTDDFYIYLK